MTDWTIAVDFDGTIAEHKFPEVGKPVPGAFEWMRKWQEAGARLILWTMRCDSPKGNYLADAIDLCRGNGVYFFGHNRNPEQSEWTTSPKAYAHIYVDDAAFGTPLIQGDGRPMVDWSVVGPEVLKIIGGE
jgi:hypothetical protein